MSRVLEEFGGKVAYGREVAINTDTDNDNDNDNDNDVDVDADAVDMECHANSLASLRYF